MSFFLSDLIHERGAEWLRKMSGLGEQAVTEGVTQVMAEVAAGQSPTPAHEAVNLLTDFAGFAIQHFIDHNHMPGLAGADDATVKQAATQVLQTYLNHFATANPPTQQPPIV